MTMRTILSGGGINSNKTLQSKAGGKVEPKAKAVNPAGAAQQGLAVQFEKQPLEAGKGYSPGKMGSTGIANASKGPSGAGPGGYGRTIYKSGSQSPTPQAREMPAGRDILSEYGPDMPGRGRR
jgi:hypothetical protein